MKDGTIIKVRTWLGSTDGLSSIVTATVTGSYPRGRTTVYNFTTENGIEHDCTPDDVMEVIGHTTDFTPKGAPDYKALDEFLDGVDMKRVK